MLHPGAFKFLKHLRFHRSLRNWMCASTHSQPLRSLHVRNEWWNASWEFDQAESCALLYPLHTSSASFLICLPDLFSFSFPFSLLVIIILQYPPCLQWKFTHQPHIKGAPKHHWRHAWHSVKLTIISLKSNSPGLWFMKDITQTAIKEENITLSNDSCTLPYRENCLAYW